MTTDDAISIIVVGSLRRGALPCNISLALEGTEPAKLRQFHTSSYASEQQLSSMSSRIERFCQLSCSFSRTPSGVFGCS